MKNKLLPLMAIVLVLTGCMSLHTGIPTNSVQLNQGNFKYVKQNVSGYSTATYFLGIGGNRRFAMIAEAKADLLEQFPLQKNQAFANVTVDFKTKSILGMLLNLVYCTYSADIIEFETVTKNPEIQQVKTPQEKGKTTSINRAVEEFFLFENPNTKERYYIHPLIKSEKIVTTTYAEAKVEMDNVFKLDGYFLPYMEELELLHKNINRLPFLPKGTYWSSESDGGKIKCFDMLLGKLVLLEPTDKAVVLPLYMLR